MSDKTNSAAPLPPPVKIAFYTTGDGQQVKDSSATGSDWFKQRALTLATSVSYVFGVSKTADAKAQIVAATQAAPSNILRLSKVYFYGHGFSEGFMLGCHWDSSITTYAAAYEQVLYDPDSPTRSVDRVKDSKDFIDELAQHLVPDFEIAFLGCHMGGALVEPLAKYLSGKGFKGKVNGYTHTYVGGLEDKTKDYDDPKQEFADALEDDDTGKISGQAHHNGIPPYDTRAPVTK